MEKGGRESNAFPRYFEKAAPKLNNQMALGKIY